jgi:hypothetical protein
MIKLVMQYRATIIEEVLDVTQQPIQGHYNRGDT